jgi:hypothetical protein
LEEHNSGRVALDIRLNLKPETNFDGMGIILQKALSCFFEDT